MPDYGNVSDSERLLNGKGVHPVSAVVATLYCTPAAAAFRAPRCSHSRLFVFCTVLLISLNISSRLEVAMNVHCVFGEVRLWKSHLGHGSCKVPTCTCRTEMLQ